MADGVLYVEIMPSTKGIGKAVEGDLNKQFKGAEKTGEGFFSKVGTWAKRGALAVGGMVAAVGALAVGGGISRALNIEDAQAKLKGLGHDTKSVETIMNDALASVKGTAFGLDAAATTAAAAVASGIKPGKELEQYLRLTADAATIAGVSMEEMGSIINKVQAKGKAQMEDLNRLTERGIPILQMLADEYGVSADEMSEMVSRGEVDAARFRKALEDNVGGAALESGNTTRGALANMFASMSRFGEVLAGPALAGAKTFFNEVTVIFDGLADRVRPWVEEMSKTLGGAFEIDGLGERVLGKLDALAGAVSSGPIPQLLSALQPLVPVLAEVGTRLGPELGQMFKEIGEALAPVLPMLAEDLTDALIELIPALVDLVVALTPIIPILADLVAGIAPVVSGLGEGLVPVLSTILSFIGDLFEVSNLGTSFRDGAISVSEFVEGLVAAGGPVSGFVLSLMQAGVQIVQFIEGVVLGIAVFKKTVTDAFSAVAGVVSSAWSTVVGTVEKGVSSVVSFVQGLPGKLIGALQGAAGWLVGVGQNIIQGLIDGVSSMIDSAVAAVRNVGGAMLDGVKSFLGIKSPSRVFRDEVGKMVGLGLLDGVEDQAIGARIDTAVNHLVSVPDGARSSAIPDSLTLVDRDGSILALVQVLAEQAIDRFAAQSGQAMRYARAGGAYA